MINVLPIYSFDTSSLIHAWRRAYPPKRFASVWNAFDNLIESGRMKASLEIYRELKKKDDDVYGWAKERKDSMFIEIDESVQEAVIDVMTKFPKLVDTGKGKSGGDPFVIAQAFAATPLLTVVTEEQGGSVEKPRIPYVCSQFGIKHINLITLIDEEDWIF